MTIRRTALAAVAAGALALTACGNDDQDNGFEPADPANASQAAADAENASIGKIGETITDDCSGYMDCQVEVTVTEITVGEQCRYGTNDYGGEGEEDFGKLEDGDQYLQVWADFAVTSDTPDDWSMMHDPQIIDADGYTQSTGMSVDCRNSDDGHEIWSTTVDAGSKSKIYGSFVIPEGSDKMVLQDKVFDLPEPSETALQDDGTGGPAPTPAAQTAEPTSAPDVEVPAQGTNGDSPLVEDLDDIAPDRHGVPGEFESGGNLDRPSAAEFDSMSNAERSNYGISAATPNDCDGYLGAHEDPDDSHC